MPEQATGEGKNAPSPQDLYISLVYTIQIMPFTFRKSDCTLGKVKDLYNRAILWHLWYNEFVM